MIFTDVIYDPDEFEWNDILLGTSKGTQASSLLINRYQNTLIQ